MPRHNLHGRFVGYALSTISNAFDFDEIWREAGKRNLASNSSSLERKTRALRVHLRWPVNTKNNQRRVQQPAGFGRHNSRSRLMTLGRPLRGRLLLRPAMSGRLANTSSGGVNYTPEARCRLSRRLPASRGPLMRAPNERSIERIPSARGGRVAAVGGGGGRCEHGASGSCMCSGR